MTGSEEWAAGVAAQFAARMREARDRLGWSAADLSRECAAFGLNIPRNVINKIEGGYRRYVTTAEQLVISYVLGVPPIATVIPIGRAAEFELVPGKVVPIDVARRWFDGSEGIDNSRPEDLERLKAARDHDQLVKRMCAAVVRFAAALDRPADDTGVRARARHPRLSESSAAMSAALQALYDVDAAWNREEATSEAYDTAKRAHDLAMSLFRNEQFVHEAFRALVDARAAMRAGGDIPPPLPADLAWVDEGVTPDA